MASRPAAATIAYVQGAGLNPNSGSSVSVTYSAAQTAGNFNVVVVAWDDTTSTVTSITDTEGNSYIQAGTSTTISGTVTQQVYYATNIAAATAGANKVTVAYSKSVTYPEVKIAEYSGISTTSPFDGMASGTGTGTAIITGSLTTTNANDLLLASDVIYGTSTGGDPNYTSRDTVGGDLEQDRIVSAVGTYTASDTQTPSSWWLIQLVAFKAASGTVPAAPTSLTNTVVSSSAINLTWTASTGATGYVIQRCAGASCTSFAQVGTSTTASYSDTGLAAGTSYSYRVDATNAAGASGFSNTTTGTTTAAVPGAPTNLTNTVVSSSQINLTWTASTGATGYVIQRCAGASCTNFAQVGTSTTASYSDTGLTAGTSYSYRVDATNAAGTSGFSNTTTGTTSAAGQQPPTTPGTLSAATASSTQVNLAWGASTDTVGVTGYLISRCSGAGCSTFTQIASVASTPLSYSNTGITAGTSYSYEVRATDAAGLFSGYSNVATAVTPTGSGTSGSVSYGYDALGRLIQVASPTINSVEALSYDAAGNITSSAATPISTESIQSFSVSQASAGERITIDGSGFSTTASSNTVTINGVTATVVSASATQLVVTVPSGASTGTVKVTVGGNTVTSAQSLKITAATSAPTITSFSPTHGTSGTSVTITGTNFSTAALDNKVLFNSAPAIVTAASATTLTVTIPVDATSGPIHVITPSGIATSATNFLAPPVAYASSTIGLSGQIVEGGSSVTVSLPTANNIALELFSGNAGDWLTIGVSGLTFSSATLSVYSPLGLQIATETITANGQSLQIPQLQSTGIYTIVVAPGSATGSVTLSLLTPVTGALTAGGASVPLALTPAGERGLVTFNGTTGQYLALELSSNTVSSANVTIIEPNGGVLLTESVTPSTASIELPQLTVSGSYSVLVDPGSVSGNVTLALVSAVTTTATVGGAAVPLTLASGQRALVSFSGTAAQYVTLFTSGNSVGTLNISVLNPGGALLTSGSLTTAAPALQLPTLPTTGTYSILLDPGSGSGSVSVTLEPAVTVAAPVFSSFQSSYTYATASLSPYDRAIVTFTGTPGQYIAFTTTEGQDSGTGQISGIQTTVYAPDGTVLNGTALMTAPTGAPTSNFSCQLEVEGCAGNSIINLGPLPTYSQGTTFTAIIQTAGGSGILGFSVTNPFASPNGPIVNGASVTKSIFYQGQGITLPVALTAGQQLYITVSESSGNLPAVQATVLDPNGIVIANDIQMSATCTSPCNTSGYSGSSGQFAFGADVSGTWTILLQQMTQTSGSNDYGPLDGGNVTVTLTSF